MQLSHLAVSTIAWCAALVGGLFVVSCGVPMTTTSTRAASPDRAAPLVTAVSADPGVLGVAVGEADTRTAEGHTLHSLVIQVRVDNQTMDDVAARTTLDGTIKRQAKTLYPDIDTFDYVNLDFISVGGVGPFTASRRFGTIPMPPRLIQPESGS